MITERIVIFMGKSLKGKELGRGITQRSDGRYCARAVVNGIKITIYDTKLSQLRKDFEKEKAECLTGIKGSMVDITLNQWFDKFAEDYKKHNIKSQSYSTIKNNYLPYRNTIGEKKISDITSVNIMEVHNARIKEGIKPDTIRKSFSVVKELFESAMSNRIITFDPTIGIKIPKSKTNPKRRTFTLDEQKLFMDYVHQFSEFYENLYVFLLNTGLRIGEAGALKWSDINFEENCVLVNKTLLYYEKELDELDSKGNPKKKRTLEISDTTKTPNGMRTVYFSSEISAILKNQRKRQLELRMKCGEKWRGTGEFENLVFTTSVGSPVGRYIAERDMKRICKMINQFEDSEFESASPHTFRRTYATRCFEADMQPKVVQALLGHANLAETMDIYTTVMEQKKMEEVKKKSVLQL